MTVPIQDPIASYSGNGVATVFTVPFRILDAADLVALLNGAVTSAYTISGLGDDEASVTMSVAPAVGDTLILYRDVALERLNDYQFNGDLRAVTVNADFDRIWMALQDIGGTASRAIHYPITEYGIDGTLPGATDRALKILGFDDSGNQTVLPMPASVGAGDLKNEAWTDGVDYTAGTSTSVTLSRAYSSKANLGTVVMQGIAQDPASYSLVGTTLTFDSVIPVGVGRIWCVGGTTVSLNQPAIGSVGPAQLADAYGTTAQRPTPVKIGQTYFDTTLGSEIVVTSVNPPVWRNVAGPNVATTDYVKGMQNLPNIMAYGGVADGVTDNSAAFVAALAASPAGRKGVFFPAGRFAFTNNINYSFPNNTASIMIAGAGPDITEIVCNLAGYPGIAITYLGPLNSAHIRDLTLTSPYAGGGNSGIFLNQTLASIANPATSALSDITNVVIRGTDGYEVTNYFSEGVLVQSVSNINFTNVMFVGSAAVSGQGVQLTATATALGVVYNFVGCSFIGNGNGIYYGQYIQGVTVTACNFACVNGILVPGGNLPGLDQLNVTASQFNCIGSAVLLQSPINAVMLIGNFVLVTPNGQGFVLQNVAQFVISGNTFNPSILPITNATAIAIGAYTAWAGVITGNQFAALTLAINLQPSSKFVNVQSNSYSGNTTNILNNGTNHTLGGGSQ